jgi:toxin ParE1/3/4
MKGIIIGPKAYADLEDYYEFIAQTNSTAALRFFDAARQTFVQIARFPEIGAVYTAIAPGQDLRKWHIKGYRKYLIFVIAQLREKGDWSGFKAAEMA